MTAESLRLLQCLQEFCYLEKVVDNVVFDGNISVNFSIGLFVATVFDKFDGII